MDFMEVAYALNDIATAGSTLQKQQLLKLYGNSVPGFKEVLEFIYDPYFTTGLKQAKLDNAGIYDNKPTVEEMMSYLKRHNTGANADACLANCFIYQSEDPVWQWAATGLATKDLQIGASVTTLNKVFGSGFIPKIGIMRGMLCPDGAKGYYLCTEKIDGNRRLIFNFDYGARAFTRSGKPDYGLVDILEEVEKKLPKGFVYDCECVAEGRFNDSIALRQASASILNQGSKARKTGVKALCFDMLPIDEYSVGRSKMNAYARKTMLATVMNDSDSVFWLQDRACLLDNMRGTKWHTAIHNLVLQYDTKRCYDLKHIAALPILGIAQNKQQGMELAEPIWARHGEGIMMVDIDSAYEVNPNPRKTLLKIKDVKEYVCKCVGIFEGTGKYTGAMGGIYVEYLASDSKYYTVGVGSGFADYERQVYWQHPYNIIGHAVELDSFGESVNADGGKSLNCPIFKRIKGHE